MGAVGAANVASAVGRSLAAGAGGTAAMTVSSRLEAELRGREPSDAPARAAGKVLGAISRAVRPDGERPR